MYLQCIVKQQTIYYNFGEVLKMCLRCSFAQMIQQKLNLPPFEITLPKYNEATLAALMKMEQSKGKGIRGKSVQDALADLKAGDDE